MAGDKQVKFTFVVDQRSLEVAKSAIRQLTSEIKTLVETMARAGSAGTGGLFGGMTGKAGPISASQQATVKGVSTALPTQGIAADARALTGMAKAGSDAMRQMTSGLRENVQGQVQQIEQLRRSLQGLDADFAKLRGLSGGNYSQLNEQVIAGIARGAEQDAMAGRWGGKRIVNKNGVDMVDSGGGVGFSGAGLPSAGRMLGLAGTALGLAYAGASMYDSAVNVPRGLISRESGFQFYGMGVGERQKGDVVSGYGGLGWKLRTDPTYRYALRRGMGGVGSVMEGAREQLRLQAENIPQTGLVSGAKEQIVNEGMGGEAWYKQAGRWGLRLSGIGALAEESLMGPAGVGTKNNALGIAQAKAKNDIDKALADKTAEIAASYVDQVPVLTRAALNEVWGNFQGRLGMEHMARSGNAPLLGVGTQFSAGEVAGMRAQLAQTGGGRFMGLAAQALGLQAGGIGAAPQIMGTAAQFHDRAGFMRALVQGSTMNGRPGLVDVAATSQIGALVAQEMGQGMSAQGGMTAGLQGIMGATAGLGGGVLAGQQMGRGYDAAKAIGSGQTSPMQMALNTIAAMRINPSLYGSMTLQELTPLEELQAARGGGVPRQLAEMYPGGGAGDAVRRYMESRNRYSFAGYRSGKGGGELDELVAQVRSQGFFETATAHLKGGQSFRELTYQLGRAQAFGRGKADAASIAAYQAYEAIQLAGNPDIVAALKGGRVGPASDASSRAAKRGQDQVVTEIEAAIRKGDVKEAVDKLGAQALADLRKVENAGVGGVSGAAERAAQALHELAEETRRAGGGSPTKSKAAKPPTTGSSVASHQR